MAKLLPKQISWLILSSQIYSENFLSSARLISARRPFLTFFSVSFLMVDKSFSLG
jgi:hypothetical protein